LLKAFGGSELTGLRQSRSFHCLTSFAPDLAVEREQGVNPKRRRHPDALFQDPFDRLVQRFLIAATLFGDWSGIGGRHNNHYNLRFRNLVTVLQAGIPGFGFS